MKSPNHIMEILSSKKINAGLYLGATPIGNLGDITLRVLGAMMQADEIWAEDTRNLRKLLQLYDIEIGSRKIVACHDHNESKLAAQCVRTIEEGRSVLYVSDAGMPVVSDPGFRLVGAVRAADLPVIILPGPSAVPTALAASGAPSDRFAFHGFAPSKKNQLHEFLQDIKSKSQTALIFESPRRLVACLEAVEYIFGASHQVCIARELTKTFEEARTGSCDDVRAHYETNPPKGEIVLVIWPHIQTATSEDDILNMLKEALQTRKMNDAVKEVAAATGHPRNAVYKLALTLKT